MKLLLFPLFSRLPFYTPQKIEYKLIHFHNMVKCTLVEGIWIKFQ